MVDLAKHKLRRYTWINMCNSFIFFLLCSCSTTPTFFGLAIFSSQVDFNVLNVGMQQEELKNSGIFPNINLSRSTSSFNPESKRMVSITRDTWAFKNSKYTRQFLYFKDKKLVGWEEVDVDGNEGTYIGQWADWPRDYK